MKKRQNGNDDNVEEARVETLLDELKDRIELLECKERELEEIRAILYVNFIQRETYGVQILEENDIKTTKLILEIIKRISEVSVNC
jgi:hypothetical protein